MAGRASITAEDYERLCDVFDELAELSSPDQRSRLAEIEKEDAQLAAILQRMLAIESESGARSEMRPIVDLAGAFHESDETDEAENEPDSPLLPSAIGPYQVLSQLGWGSVGDVYLAHQAQPVERPVAVKLLRHSRTQPDSKRYAVEARALSSLSHPGIAQIFDAGTMRDGRPYLVMEYVDGKPIDAVCRENDLDREARLRLFIDLCDAVHYAHQQGVIHRDLKPSNILVTHDHHDHEHHGKPQVKVIDFGIARLTGELADFHQTMTMHGELLGTLAYMSPEQLLGSRVDTRADIYALGVILHQLLTNRLPHDLAGKSLGEALRIVSNESPTRQLAADRSLRGDLETIVGAAMHRDPRHRYDSVHALAEDVARHLRFEPITIRRPGHWYVARKFLRRNRLLSAVTAAILLLLVVGVYMTDDARRDALAAHQEAERQHLEARRMSGFFLHDVVTRLERLPGSGEIRQSLMAELLRQTRGFIDERPNDPSVLDDHARALIAQANLLQTGTFPRDHHGAWPYVVEAVAVREQLAERWPDHPDYQMELALAYTRRGDVARDLGNHGSVLADYHRALQIHQRLVELAPDSRRYLDNLFWDYNRIGARLHLQGDSSALAWHQDALKVARELERRFPDHYLTTYALSQAHIHMAEQYETRGRDESALEHARLAVLHADRLNEIYPHSWHFMRQHRRVALAHTKIVQQSGSDAEKLEALTRFRKAAEAMHQIEPGNSVWARDMERARQWLAEPDR